MNRLKKFWIAFLSLMPLTAGAAAPLLLGGVGAAAIAGFSIYRNSAPVNMADALSFFTSCWTCQMFSDVMAGMSNILPPVYEKLGLIMIPVLAGLTAIWFVSRITGGFLDAKVEDPWTLTGVFGTHFIKLGLVISALLLPVPRMVTDIAIEPIFNVGLSLNRAVAGHDRFAQCIVATAVADAASVGGNTTHGAFSPKLRHNLACELANVHQMTGVGMTVGWTMLNMAFDTKYMHKLMWNIPIFPNVPMLFGGLMIIVLFLFALLPIPIYFLEVFIKLAMDLIMLPFMMMGWLFSKWSVLKNSGRTIEKMMDDVIQGTVGIAVVGIFVTFAIMFLSAVFGKWGGAAALDAALAQNDSQIIMDGLMLRNDSLITVVLMGIFIAMFMISIPELAKSLFNVSVAKDYYNTTKGNIEKLLKGVKNIYGAIKK